MRTWLSHPAALTAATGVLLAGAALMVLGTWLNRPLPTVPQPPVSPQLTCQLAVIRAVPVPPPADMTFTAVRTVPAAGGGYEVTGLVAVQDPPRQWPFTCDVELRVPGGWHVWSVRLAAAAPRVEVVAADG